MLINQNFQNFKYFFIDSNFWTKNTVSCKSWHSYSNSFNCIGSFGLKKACAERFSSIFCYWWSWFGIFFWFWGRFKECAWVSKCCFFLQTVAKFLYHRYLPTDYQCVLTSATLSEDIQSLKQLVLHQPVTLKLEEPELPPASQLTQYQIYAEEWDKAVLIYALFKLGLVRGKTIIFVRNVDRCYK